MWYIQSDNVDGAHVVLSPSEVITLNENNPVTTVSGEDIVGVFRCPKPIEGSLTQAKVRELLDEESRMSVVFSIGFSELCCISSDGTLDGLNEYVDEYVFGHRVIPSDITYKLVGVMGEEAIIKLTCEVDEAELDVTHNRYFIAGPADPSVDTLWQLCGTDNDDESTIQESYDLNFYDVITTASSEEEIKQLAKEYTDKELEVL
jgi:hypothetical protein